MWFRPPRDKRLVAALLAVLMAAMVVLGSTSSPPTVPIGSISNLDEGTRVVILGAIADMSLRDGGAESLVLADLVNGSTIRVYCSPGVRVSPSQYASIGDELRVEGELSRAGSSPILFTSAEEVTLIKDSESILTIEALSRNWALFVGDSIELSGVVVPSSNPGGYRLADEGLEHTIALCSEVDGIETMVGKVVSVVAFLRLLPETMELAIEVVSVSPGRW